MIVPDYLKEPSLSGHIYGKLIYIEDRDLFKLSGEPLLLQYAKRIFPGAKVTRGGGGYLEFHRTRREIADLNWLLLRFAVDISQCKSILSEERDQAVNQFNSRMFGFDKRKTKPPSDFLGELYPFQETAVTFLNTNKRCLLSDAMGVGKTFSSLGAVATANEYPVLVVCQTHIQKQWQRVIGTLFDLPGLKGKDGMTPFELSTKRGQALAPILKSRKAYRIPNTPFAIIHYGLMAWWEKEVLNRGFKTIIFDEVQELRHTGTGKYSAASKFSEKAELVWGLSGTPVFGYGREIWSVMNAIDFHCLGSEEAFTREWCTGYGEKIVSDPGALNGHLLREGLMLRRRASDPDVAIDLPQIIRKVEDIDYDELLYDRLIKATMGKAKEYSDATFHMKGRLAREIERESRKASGVAKARYVAEFVSSLIESGERPLVYAWHHDVHDIYKSRLAQYKPAIFTGKQTVNQKEDGLRRFMDGETNVAVLSLRSAAGLDGLQYRASMCVFGELDWSPAIFGQCETRISRIGVDERLEDVPSYYCVSSVGFDEIMLDVLGVKTGQFTGVMGDEPESYEEKTDAEKRAEKRIEHLVNKLKKENNNNTCKKTPDSYRINNGRLNEEFNRKLINVFRRKLKDGNSDRRKEKDKK